MEAAVGSKRSASAWDSPTFNLDMSIHVDRPVGSMSISPCGRDVALGSRQGLHIIDLDNPYSPPRHLPHHTPWEVADVQWSPFGARDYWVISTSNQKALVWNLAAIPSHGSSIEFVLHAHTRAITDINFSAHDPDILATCAVDSFVHCWDLRTPRKPVATFCDWFAGATQVKWNRQDSHIIASSHDKCLRIWDNRKGAIPVRSIEAHETKIYGVDWNRTRPSAVVTCSLDKTIKFWDYKNLEDEPERIIRTPFPVWRARHTPFGWGICAMPQRGSNDLHLYDRRVHGLMGEDDETPPVVKFEGHRDQVKEFLWRPRGNISDGTDHREFQLVSWSTDRDLRLHRVDEEALEKVGFHKGTPVLRQYNYTRNDATYRTFHDEVSAKEHRKEHDDQLNHDNLPITTEDNRAVTGTQGMLTVSINKTSALINGLIDKAYASSRTGMSGRSTARRDVNLIEWMKGVKIGKSKVTAPEARHGSTHDPQAYLPHNFGTATGWDAPESLFDEITHVGDKYKRVTFENLDSQRRLATISMNGPWGDEEKPVHVKIAIQFPDDYPEASVPTFDMEKTSSIPDEIFETISGGIQLIAQGYISRKMGCLEPIVCFLLGERGLEDSTAMLEDRENALSDSSSDDEDPTGPDLLSLPAEDLELGGNGLLGMANSNANVPLPKACGALFAADGRLVCFFQPKEDEQRSVVNSLTLKDSDRSNRELRHFEGFGRIHATSPETRPLVSSIMEETDDPNGSDEYWTDSSDASSDIGVSALAKGLPRLPWGQSYDRRRPKGPLSTDHSQFSGGTGSAVKSNFSKIKSVVSIRSLDDIQPCKKTLAEAYVVRGDPRIVSKHNATVALRIGDQGLSATWDLISLLLSDEVPLEVAQLESSSAPILVIAQKANKVRRDSGIDLAFDKLPKDKVSGLRGQVKWGPHPFGQTWLVPRIFEYYERIGDVQMLAMLSCVLTESLPKEDAMVGYGESTALTWPRSSHHYSRSPEIAFSLRQASLTIPVIPKVANASGSNGSDASTGKFLYNEIGRTQSTSITPPNYLQRDRLSPAQIDSQPGSLSVSPEQHHHRRSSAALSSHSPTEVSRSLPSNSISSATPAALRKRPSPVEAVLSNLGASGVTWGANTIFGSSHSGKRSSTEIATFSDSDSASSDAPEKRPHSRLKKFAFQKRNQHMFDQESHLNMPLLDPTKADVYRGYRAAYAGLLDVWDLQMKRVELLKYNGIVSSAHQHFSSFDSSSNAPDGTDISLGRKRRDTSLTSNGEGQWTGLEVLRICRRCGTPAPRAPYQQTSVKRASCHSCGTPLNRLACDICWSPILGVYTACLDCGQVAHCKCLEEMEQNSFGSAFHQRACHSQREQSEETEESENTEGDEPGLPEGKGQRQILGGLG